jgi:hypothetical protein
MPTWSAIRTRIGSIGSQGSPRALGRQCRLKRGRRGGEDRLEGVAHGLDDIAAVGIDRLASRSSWRASALHRLGLALPAERARPRSSPVSSVSPMRARSRWIRVRRPEKVDGVGLTKRAAFVYRVMTNGPVCRESYRPVKHPTLSPQSSALSSAQLLAREQVHHIRPGLTQNVASLLGAAGRDRR